MQSILLTLELLVAPGRHVRLPGGAAGVGEDPDRAAPWRVQRADGVRHRPGHTGSAHAGRPDRRGRVVWPVRGEPDREYRPDHRRRDFRRARSGEPAKPGITEYRAAGYRRAAARRDERRQSRREEPSLRLAQRPHPPEQAGSGAYPPGDPAYPSRDPADHTGA